MVVPPVPAVVGGGVVVRRRGRAAGPGRAARRARCRWWRGRRRVVAGGGVVCRRRRRGRAGGVVAGGVSVPALPPAPAVGAPLVPGAPAAEEGAPEPETPPVDEVGVVGLPVEPPVAAGDLLELPAEPPVPAELCGSTVAPEPPSSCDPPEPAPDAQLIVRDAASGSSVARKRERTLLCFDFERDMSPGTGGDRTSDVYVVRAPQAQTLSRRSDAEAADDQNAGARKTRRARSEQLAEPGDLIVGGLQPDLHALLFDARERLR